MIYLIYLPLNDKWVTLIKIKGESMQHVKAFAIIAPLILTTAYVSWENSSISSTSQNAVAQVTPIAHSTMPSNIQMADTTATQNNTTQTQTWNSYSAYGNDQLVFEKKKISIQDSKYYEKQYSTAEITDIENPAYFTAKNLYQSNDRVDGRLGTHLGQITQINDQVIQYIPYSTQLNANDLVFTKKIQTVDLSGQHVLHNIFFDQFNIMDTQTDLISTKNNVGIALYDWLTSKQELSFPAGSKCFRVLTEENSVPYIKSDKSLLTETVSNPDHNENWELFKKENSGSFINFPNISGYFEFDDLNKKHFGIVEYNGVHHYADYYPSKVSFDYRASINQVQELLESDKTNPINREKIIQHLKTNKCDFYNDVASKTIEKNFIKI